MNEQDTLSPEEHARVFREEILPEYKLSNNTSLEKPRAIIIGGQPGSGKGRLADAVKTELYGDVVTVDPDALRDYHPRVHELRNVSPYDWSRHTQADAGGWADELRDAAVAGRKNFIFDTTLSNGEWTSELIRDLQAKGYEVEVRVIAAHKLESEHGVDERFTKRLDQFGYSRYVPEGARDAIYNKVPASLDTIHARTDVPIRIFNREGVELYDSRTDLRLPGQALEEARNTRLREPAVTQALREGWEQQADWHRDLPEHARHIPNTDDATQSKLLEEHAKLKVGEGVAFRAEGAATIDELVRPGAPPARIPTPEPEIPGLRRAGATAGLAGLGLTASAIDAHQTGERVSTLLAQDNRVAAQSELTHFAARGLGGWAGGTATVAVVGTSGFAPMALTAADAYFLSEAAERGAKLLDNHRIYRQTDRDGVAWQFNGRDWVREEMGDLTQDAVDNPAKLQFSALPEQARELNFLASNEAAQQAMGKAQPRNPYVLPADEDDRAHLYQRDWRHDPATSQWSRMVADEVNRNDQPVWRSEEASGERSVQLNQRAVQVIEANIASGPAAIAMDYQRAYHQHGWRDFGPMSLAVHTALNPDTLQASNGQQYQRDAQGQWRQEGERAQGNIALELEATHQRLQPVLAQHVHRMATLPERTLPTPEQQDHANLAATYASYGVAPNAERMDAVWQAVQHTRATHGIDPATTSLALERSEHGGYDIDSPISHLYFDHEGVVRVAAVTSVEDIRQVLPHAPDRAVTAAIEPNTTAAPVPTAVAPEMRASPTPLAIPQATPSPEDQILQQWMAALEVGDEQGMSAACRAMASSEFGQRAFQEAEDWQLEQLQQIPGRDHPLFTQAADHLERLGPRAAGYWDRVEMEQMVIPPEIG